MYETYSLDCTRAFTGDMIYITDTQVGAEDTGHAISEIFVISSFHSGNYARTAKRSHGYVA